MHENLFNSNEYRFISQRPSQSLHTYLGKNRLQFSAICDRFGTDKDSNLAGGREYIGPPHTYGEIYSRIFYGKRLHVRNVFECGIGSINESLESNMGKLGFPGASLRMWKEFFPKAKIFGADIDPDTLFEEKRIKTYCMDQTDPISIGKVWKKIGRRKMDVIVDDGLHKIDAAISLFQNSYENLAQDGLYIIEDVLSNEASQYFEFFSQTEFDLEFIFMPRVDNFNSDNNMIILRRNSLE